MYVEFSICRCTIAPCVISFTLLNAHSLMWMSVMMMLLLLLLLLLSFTVVERLYVFVAVGYLYPFLYVREWMLFETVHPYL